MKRVVVLGNSCAGKTTFATRLSRHLGFKHIELDALFWEPGWTEADLETFRSRVLSEVQSETWVVDGNYKSRIKDLVWPHADTIIWLDPSLFTVLIRFFRRSFERAFKQELLWNGCRESLRNSIFQRNSLLAWILKTHTKKSKDYIHLIENPPTGTNVYRLRTVSEIEAFFSKLNAP